MGLRKILTYKDPALHKVCRPVEKFDWRLHKLLNDMTDTLAWGWLPLRWAFCAGW